MQVMRNHSLRVLKKKQKIKNKNRKRKKEKKTRTALATTTWSPKFDNQYKLPNKTSGTQKGGGRQKTTKAGAGERASVRKEKKKEGSGCRRKG